MSTAYQIAGLPVPTSKKGDPPWEIALLFPEQGNWSESDYLQLDDMTNSMIELVDGNLEILPMPSIAHQRISRFLERKLETYVSTHDLRGEVFHAPLPVRLGDVNFREPDILFVLPERTATRNDRLNGADWVLEIVSPGEKNRKRDLVDKREAYAGAGIVEYWIVDPEEETILVLVLEGDAYREFGRYQKGQMARSNYFEGFEVSATEVFASAHGPQEG